MEDGSVMGLGLGQSLAQSADFIYCNNAQSALPFATKGDHNLVDLEDSIPEYIFSQLSISTIVVAIFFFLVPDLGEASHPLNL